MSQKEKKNNFILRLVILFLLLSSIYVLGNHFGLTKSLNRSEIQATMEGAGLAGILIFIGAFIAGNLLHIPGMVFVLTSIFAYGCLVGCIVAIIGSVISCTTSFAIVRTIGGKALGEVKKPLIRKMLDKLEDRPVSIIVLLRTVMISSPSLNYALALTEIRYRDYLLGTALGVCIPIVISSFIFSRLMA